MLYHAPQFQAEKKFPFGGPGGGMCASFCSGSYLLYAISAEKVMHPLLEDCRRAIPGPLFIIRPYRRVVHAVKAYVQCSLQMRCHFRNNAVAPHIRSATNLVVNLKSNGFVSQSIHKLSQLNHKILPSPRNKVFCSFIPVCTLAQQTGLSM